MIARLYIRENGSRLYITDYIEGAKEISKRIDALNSLLSVKVWPCVIEENRTKEKFDNRK